MASGVALMDAIENRKSQIVELDPSDRSKDWRIIDILSVDIAFDTFRSEVARCLTLFVSARGFVSYHDVMALFRLKNHIYTVADVQSETDAKEEETRIGRKVHGAELEMYAYKCYVIVRYLNDLDDHPVFVRLKRAHPNAGYAMEYEHELTTEAAQKEKAK